MRKSFLVWAWCVSVAMVVCARGGEDQLAERKELLSIGQTLPEFTSIDERGQPWKSSDYVGHKAVVIYFYPGDFTGGCIKQAQAFRESLKSLEDLDVEVVGVSGDQAATHRLFRQSHQLAHTLLADPEGTLAMQLGIPVWRLDKAATVRAIDLERRPLLDDQGKPISVERMTTYPRWTLIINRNGQLISKRTQVNPSTDADEVRKIADSLSR
jgi:thioredoxin-dependent peroxiredoxin